MKRRTFVGAASASAVLAACTDATHATEDHMSSTTASARQPVLFVPHGGGPWPFVDVGMGDKREVDALLGYLKSLKHVAAPPKALLVISAHWEERDVTLMTHPSPPMLYDYYGFPEASYHIQWPAPGATDLAPRVAQLLEASGIKTRTDAQRGYDHGTFVPLKVAFPEANIPTLQLSLKAGLDPKEHLAIGQALSPLRDEGVLIIGSGMSFHNLRAFFDGRANAVAEQFDTWLKSAVTQPRAERAAALCAWETAPAARAVHPREEHLLPLMVCAGAAGDDAARIPYNDTFMGKRLSAVQFG